jgi:predicted Fe-Mo cluster-binding NifX family protein
MRSGDKWRLLLLGLAVALLAGRATYEKGHPLVLHGKKARIVAIASTGQDIHSPVSYLFGRAPYFIICDRLKHGYKCVPNKYKDAQHAAGLRASRMLVKEKVDAICGNNIGFEPARVFEEANVELYTNAGGTVWEVLQAFPDSLEKVTAQTVPAHFGITGSKTRVACTSFDAAANIEHVVQGRFWVCFDCSYRVAVDSRGAKSGHSCPKCGMQLHEIITVASPPSGGIKPTIRVF